MRYINEVAKKMARNGLKLAKSLGCAFHFESEFKLNIAKKSYSLSPTLANLEAAVTIL